MNHSLAGKNGPQPTAPFRTDREQIAESKAFRVAWRLRMSADVGAFGQRHGFCSAIPYNFGLILP
jgi:hypothetical protein